MLWVPLFGSADYWCILIALVCGLVLMEFALSSQFPFSIPPITSFSLVALDVGGGVVFFV